MSNMLRSQTCGSTARNSLAFVAFGLWWKRPLLTHNPANPDLRVCLNSAEVMEGDEGEHDAQRREQAVQEKQRRQGSLPCPALAGTEDL